MIRLQQWPLDGRHFWRYNRRQAARPALPQRADLSGVQETFDLCAPHYFCVHCFCVVVQFWGGASRTVAANRKTMPCAFPGLGAGQAGGPGRRVCQLRRFPAGRTRAFLMPGRYLCTPGFPFPEFNTSTFIDVSSPARAGALLYPVVRTQHDPLRVEESRR